MECSRSETRSRLVRASREVFIDRNPTCSMVPQVCLFLRRNPGIDRKRISYTSCAETFSALFASHPEIRPHVVLIDGRDNNSGPWHDEAEI